MRKYTMVDKASGDENEADADTVVRWSGEQHGCFGHALGAPSGRVLSGEGICDHLCRTTYGGQTVWQVVTGLLKRRRRLLGQCPLCGQSCRSLGLAQSPISRP